MRNVRFPVPPGWTEQSLGSVATLQRGFDLPVAGSVPVYAANGIIGYHDEARIVGPGVVTGRSGTIGKVHYVHKDFWPLNTTLFVLDFHGNDAEFVWRLLEAIRVEELANGTGVPTLNRNDVHPIRVVVPPLAEQQSIAAIFRTWDKAAEKTKRLIERTQDRRTYFHRELVSWSRWPKCALGNVIKSVSRPLPTPKTAYKALSIRSHGKGTFQRLVERPEEVDMETVYVVGASDLIVNITFAWEGAIALAKPGDAGCYVSHRFPTFEVDEAKVNREFLGYAVRTRRFFHNLGIASPGGAGRNRVLNIHDFFEIDIPLPPKNEQDRIAAFLGTADREIELLEAQKAAIEKQKRGLMQKLLTGEWRVPIDNPSNEPAKREAAG